jgi:hypothetical protein
MAVALTLAALGRHQAGIAALALAVGVMAPALTQAQSTPRSGGTGAIYSCTDDRGRKLTSDRPIAECAAKEQRVLNSDGSLRTIHPPTLTAEERAAKEVAERRAAEARAALADAARRDRNLMSRYRSEAAHGKAREAALDALRAAMRGTELRLQTLADERKPLLDEAEFYKGRALPPKLKQQLDANDAASEAQRAAAGTQQAELERVNRLYDAELDRLRRLWAGAVPGSMGPLQAPARAVTVPTTPSASASR